MNKMINFTDLASHPIIPVVVLDRADLALDLAQALLAGGISIMEITLRTSQALAAISIIREQCPTMIVGSGTVINPKLYRLSIEHGAQFVVAPGISSELIKISAIYDVPFIPGIITPTEAMKALSAGLNYVKFFPAENFNAYQQIKTLATVFPQLKFCPTGGIDLSNINRYLNLNNVFAVGMSAIVPNNLIAQLDFNKITQLSAAAMTIINRKNN